MLSRNTQAGVSKYGKVARGSQKLFPSSVSEFCHKDNFEWKELASEM